MQHKITMDKDNGRSLLEELPLDYVEDGKFQAESQNFIVAVIPQNAPASNFSMMSSKPGVYNNTHICSKYSTANLF